MTCASCVLQVEKALLAEPGVERVTVNLATNTAQVIGDEATVDGQRLQRAVRKAGYDLLITEADDAVVEAERIQVRRLADLQRRLWMAVALSTPLVIVAMFLMHEPWANWVMWTLSTPVVLIFGRQFFGDVRLSVEILHLVHDHRVWIAQGGLHQTLSIVRSRRADDLDSRSIEEPCLVHLAVVQRTAAIRTSRTANMTPAMIG